MRRSATWFALFTSDQDEPHCVCASRAEAEQTRTDWAMEEAIIRRVVVAWNEPKPPRRRAGRGKR